MSDEVPVTEIFEDVEPDPDAIIASFGAESVDDLIEGPGEHDPVAHPEFDGDVDRAADRLRELADVRLETEGESTRPHSSGSTTRERDAGDESGAGGEITYDGDSPGDSPGGDVRVDVLPGDGQTIEEFLGLDDLATAERTERDELVLVGPAPSSTRISNDSFGPAGGTVGSTRDRTRWGTTRESTDAPDPFAVDGDAVTERDAELASSVFEWVS